MKTANLCWQLQRVVFAEGRDFISTFKNPKQPNLRIPALLILFFIVICFVAMFLDLTVTIKTDAVDVEESTIDIIEQLAIEKAESYSQPIETTANITEEPEVVETESTTDTEPVATEIATESTEEVQYYTEVIEPDYSQDQLLISNEASSFKSYMDYRLITNTASVQYQLQTLAYTDENGLRKINDCYCVAMGTYYGSVGDILYIETDEGNSWKVILADMKADAHTDWTNRYTTANGCMMEFIVDTPAVPQYILLSGTVNDLGFSGNIIYIEKLN